MSVQGVSVAWWLELVRGLARGGGICIERIVARISGWSSVADHVLQIVCPSFRERLQWGSLKELQTCYDANASLKGFE